MPFDGVRVGDDLPPPPPVLFDFGDGGGGGGFPLNLYMLRFKRIAKVGVMEWGPWQSTGRHMLFRCGRGEVYVSTVFLGVDAIRVMSGGRPVLFETMIIGGRFDLTGFRGTTYAGAKRTHYNVAKKLFGARAAVIHPMFARTYMKRSKVIRRKFRPRIKYESKLRKRRTFL